MATPPETVDELLAYIEDRFPCVDGLETYACQTGEFYRSIAIGYIPTPDIDLDIGAIAALKQSFDTYAADKVGTLYWRTRPYREQIEDRVYSRMRLVISDKPAIYTSRDAFPKDGPSRARAEAGSIHAG